MGSYAPARAPARGKEKHRPAVAYTGMPRLLGQSVKASRRHGSAGSQLRHGVSDRERPQRQATPPGDRWPLQRGQSPDQGAGVHGNNRSVFDPAAFWPSALSQRSPSLVHPPDLRTVDPAQVAHFDGDAGKRWSPDGPARWLYRYNAVRVPYIRDAACSAFNRDPSTSDPLRGLRILDIGCGAGILCEPLAQLGAAVVGADPAENTLQAAATRARQMNLDIAYRSETAETLLEAGERFDVVLAMEVIEHVADHRLFLQTCAGLTGPNGLVILSTINRTLKSWVQAIVMGEYILGLLPRGAHRWDRFVTPEEIRDEMTRNGMRITDVSGVTMNLRTQAMQLSAKTGVNYMLAAHR